MLAVRPRLFCKLTTAYAHTSAILCVLAWFSVAHKFPLACPQVFPELPTRNTCVAHNCPLDCPQVSPGLPISIPWLAPKVSPRLPTKFPLGCPQDLSGLPKSCSLLQMGSSGGKSKGPPPAVKKLLGLFGSQREEDRMVGYLSFLKLGPKLLKFLPGKPKL